MSEHPWKKKNNKFTWLSSLYNPFKCDESLLSMLPNFLELHLILSKNRFSSQNFLFGRDGGGEGGFKALPKLFGAKTTTITSKTKSKTN